jgi:orotate phosphoribosyltransferase
MEWIMTEPRWMATSHGINHQIGQELVAGTPEGGIIHSIALVVRGSNPTLLVFYAKSTKKHY